MAQVSVIMPVWNGERYLRAAVESVLGQTLEDFELIVIDDGSTDGTLNILRSYGDRRLRIIEREHGGIVRAMNFGIRQARGACIARLDADDISMPNRLEVQMGLLGGHPRAVLCFSDAERFGDGPLPDRSRLARSRALLALRMCMQCPIVHSSVVFRKAAFDTAGGYLDEERHAEDFGLWGRMIELGSFVCDSRCLVRFRLHGQSVSQQSSTAQRSLRRRIAERHCERFMRLGVDSARRAAELLARDPGRRRRSEWLWFLARCASRLRWKSPELGAWLAKQTLYVMKGRG